MVVGVGGFDLRVSVSSRSLAQLGEVGSAVVLHTHLYLREDVVAIYGFAEPNELSLFAQLLTVSGVGPRMALALLSTLGVDGVRAAVLREDAHALVRAPGVGAKLAGRLILELKSRIGSSREQAPPPQLNDVEQALVGLGLTPAEAQQAIEHDDVAAATTTEEKIKRALQAFATRRR